MNPQVSHQNVRVQLGFQQSIFNSSYYKYKTRTHTRTHTYMRARMHMAALCDYETVMKFGSETCFSPRHCLCYFNKLHQLGRLSKCHFPHTAWKESDNCYPITEIQQFVKMLIRIFPDFYSKARWSETQNEADDDQYVKSGRQLWRLTSKATH